MVWSCAAAISLDFACSPAQAMRQTHTTDFVLCGYHCREYFQDIQGCYEPRSFPRTEGTSRQNPAILRQKEPTLGRTNHSRPHSIRIDLPKKDLHRYPKPKPTPAHQLLRSTAWYRSRSIITWQTNAQISIVQPQGNPQLQLAQQTRATRESACISD